MLQEFTGLLDHYASNRNQVDLYLHLDKSVYLHNENIWFTAYILNSIIGAPEQHTLYVLLVDQFSRKIVATERYVLDHGLGGGSLFLPDSLPDSEYRLIAYTNTYSTHQDHRVFQQAITLKSAAPPLFKLTKINGSYSAITDSTTIDFKLTTSYGGVGSDAEFNYGVYIDGVNHYNGSKKVNAFGELSLTMARNDILGHQSLINSTVIRSKQKQPIRLSIPLFLNRCIARLYPEGGILIDGHSSYTAVELKNGASAPIATTGQLIEDGLPVASFSTDLLGIGVIKFSPKAGSEYKIQLDSDTLQLEPSYFLEIHPASIGLHIEKGVISNDTIYAQVLSQEPDTCHIVAHNYRNIFYSATIVPNKKSSILKILATDMPQGVMTLTLFNKRGQPISERAIYIMRPEPLNVLMIADSTNYHNRSKVLLKVKITDKSGAPVQGFFSTACVLSSRLDTTRSIDIVRYNQFDRFLPMENGLPGGRYLQVPENIERLLLTRFWTKYKWNDVAQKLTSTHQVNLDSDTGHILYNGRKIKKPVPIVIAGGRRPQILETDSLGAFIIPNFALRTDAGQQLNVLLPGYKDKDRNYSITLKERPGPFDLALTERQYPVVGYTTADITVKEQQILKTALKAVTVTASTNDVLEGVRIYKSETCRDWVCMNNILNCTNHPYGTTPVRGRRYRYFTGEVTYMGCNLRGPGEVGEFIKAVNGITYPKEFYVADYSLHNPLAAEILSTVFWSYKTITDANGEAIISFSTNDLNGRFTCIIQGYSDQGPFTAKSYFRVVQ